MGGTTDAVALCWALELGAQGPPQGCRFEPAGPPVRLQVCASERTPAWAAPRQHGLACSAGVRPGGPVHGKLTGAGPPLHAGRSAGGEQQRARGRPVSHLPAQPPGEGFYSSAPGLGSSRVVSFMHVERPVAQVLPLLQPTIHGRCALPACLLSCLQLLSSWQHHAPLHAVTALHGGRSAVCGDERGRWGLARWGALKDGKVTLRSGQLRRACLWPAPMRGCAERLLPTLPLAHPTARLPAGPPSSPSLCSPVHGRARRRGGVCAGPL